MQVLQLGFELLRI